MPRLITSNLSKEFEKVRNQPPITVTSGGEEVIQKARGMVRGANTLGTTRVVEPFFQPFLERTTIELPTSLKDKIKWRRYFFENEPIVGAACELHAEFPLSTFWISHEDPVLRRDFEDMCERLGLFEFLLDMLLEYYVVGEVFPMGMFDDVKDPKMWTEFILLDPSLVDVQWEPLVKGRRKEVITLNASETLKKIVNSGPADKETGDLYKQLPPDVVTLTRKGEKMPLSSLQVSHIKRKGNYFSPRGSSIIDRTLKLLMYRDKMRSAQYAIADRHICYDEETECLTKDGFKKYYELTMDDEIAAFDKETGCLEYQKPEFIYVSKYKGKMVQFKGAGVDMLVTPNHKMLWFDTKYKEWTTIEAKDLPNRGRLRTVIDRWKGEIPFKTVTLDRRIGKIIKGEETGRFEGHFENFKQDLPLEDYLRFVGYWISEGSWSGVKKPTLNSQTQVVVYQQTTSPCYKEMEEFFDTFQIKFNKYTAVTKTKAGGKVYKRNMTTWSLCDDELAKHLIENYGAHAYDKHLPVWVKNLPREYLKILLDVMVAGDGSEEKDSSYTTKKGEKRIYKRLRRSYYSTSKQLADDIQEIVYKMGYAPKLRGYIPKQDVYYYRPIYTVYWSETTKFGHFPHLQAFQKWGVKKEFVEYDSTIWCVGVPNHFFVTRRNGNPCVSSNSPKEFYFIGSEAEPASQDEINDFRDLLAQQWSQPNQAIVYHHAVRVQWEGAAGRILPLQPEFQYLDKQLAIALLINEGILTAERQPYASTSVALDVMIQRYLTIRMRIENWIENKVFKPICRLHKIYKRTKNEIEHRIKLSHTEESLWIPKVKWDKEELRNDLNKVRLLIELADKNWLPRSMVLPFLNVDPDTARKEVRMEKAKDKKEGFTGEPGMPGMPGMGAPTLPMSPPGEDEVPLSPEEMSLPEAPEGEGGAVPPESHEGTLPGEEGSFPTSV